MATNFNKSNFQGFKLPQNLMDVEYPWYSNTAPQNLIQQIYIVYIYKVETAPTEY